mmetsp:Transcript_9275/g.11123  ORF Transcript_9275/g.11123 Transcript_9275/m.11123 type:complete len:146 (+) Transcript_9275:173-610(+)|eukprot:CAMPEP_0184026078 /NCGR_PEP_ID=MMETSP0954-20121128/13268_1 /TAXON_ID=627963 /ORGANISM="Aplanochytrium sp, Strain PBS07" /LENGTH=145 /DNA_ID=CAMNT_0026310137 /DNA_START=158 /DNA_END=595 /DNA_ORIENTATION=-
MNGVSVSSGKPSLGAVASNQQPTGTKDSSTEKGKSLLLEATEAFEHSLKHALESTAEVSITESSAEKQLEHNWARSFTVACQKLDCYLSEVTELQHKSNQSHKDDVTQVKVRQEILALEKELDEKNKLIEKYQKKMTDWLGKLES